MRSGKEKARNVRSLLRAREDFSAGEGTRQVLRWGDAKH